MAPKHLSLAVRASWAGAVGLAVWVCASGCYTPPPARPMRPRAPAPVPVRPRARPADPVPVRPQASPATSSVPVNNGVKMVRTVKQYGEHVLRSSRPVLVNFYSEYCGGCRAMEPILERVAVAYVGRIDVVRVRTEKSFDLMWHYKITGTPSSVFYKGGQEVQRIRGFQTEPQLRQILDVMLQP